MVAFPPEPLRQYALLADGERGAVVGPRGDVAFLCFPRWHDDARWLPPVSPEPSQQGFVTQ